jgi:hypothetical protein
MPRINILQLGTRGVDMKSNPLLLGNKKLHAATNMVFEEGVLRTRPGFRYSATGATGQFQGASEYRPSKGISAGRFSSADDSVAIAAGGVLFVDGTPVAANLAAGASYHIYQAENYLIAQCESARTLWWDGSKITESPGMSEQDWNDPEPPLFVDDYAPPELT